MRTVVVEHPFVRFVNRFKCSSLVLQRTFREHNLQTHEDGYDYFLNVIDNGMTAYLTVQRANVKLQDHILIKNQGELIRYQVQEIDYFADPADVCMLMLRRV
jgi:hypothetical protein